MVRIISHFLFACFEIFAVEVLFSAVAKKILERKFHILVMSVAIVLNALSSYFLTGTGLTMLIMSTVIALAFGLSYKVKPFFAIIDGDFIRATTVRIIRAYFRRFAKHVIGNFPTVSLDNDVGRMVFLSMQPNIVCVCATHQAVVLQIVSTDKHSKPVEQVFAERGFDFFFLAADPFFRRAKQTNL